MKISALTGHLFLRRRAFIFWYILVALPLHLATGSSAKETPEAALQQLARLTPDSALPFLEKFLKQPHLPASTKCRALLLAAEASSKNSDFILAEHYAEQALQLARKSAPNSEPHATRMLAKVYQSTKRFASGQKLLQRALVLFEKQGNKKEITDTRIDLIEFYRASADPYMAWRLYQNLKPELLAGELTPYQAARLLHRAAAASIEGKINDSVVVLSQKSLAISVKHGFTDHMATSYNELGHYYRHLKQYDLSLHYLQKAEKLLLEAGNTQDLLVVLRNQTMLYTKMGQLEKADALMARLRDFPQNPVLFKNTTEYAVMESTIHRLKGNYQEAFTAMERALKIQRDITRKVHTQEMNELTAKYRTALAEKRASEDREAAVLASQEAIKHRLQRNTAYSIGAIAVISLFLLGLAYHSNRKKKKQLEVQNLSIDQINKLLSNSLQVQESLYSELQHRVKNNLSVLSSLLYLQSNKSTGIVKQALSQTHSRVEALAMLHQQLLGKDKGHEQVRINSYIESLFTHLQATFQRPGLSVDYEINCEEITLQASVVTSIGLALNELITNSYKHAFTNTVTGKITLWCRTESGLLHVIYRDSGPGIAGDNLFGKSESLGMSIIQLLVRQHKGNFHYFRENGFSCFELFFTINDLTKATASVKSGSLIG